MDRHRPQQLQRGNGEAGGEIRGDLLPCAGAQRAGVYKVAASISRIFTFDSRRSTSPGWHSPVPGVSTDADAAATATQNASSSGLPAASAATRPPTKLS